MRERERGRENYSSEKLAWDKAQEKISGLPPNGVTLGHN